MKPRVVALSLFSFFCVALVAPPARPCTSYLVSPGASQNGAALISYAGDSHIRFGQVYFRPRATWPEGARQTIYDRSSNKPLGDIPYPPETHQVVGFINEHQVAIGESTFGGRKELADKTARIDWGSLMFLGLERGRTAREALKVMVELVEEFGFYSGGQSYSIADPNEVWLLEIVGKGEDIRTRRRTKESYNARKGAVWVAMRIPDGYVSAHANHSRITTFPREEDSPRSLSSRQLDRIFEPEVEVVYAHDVIDFARSQGYFEGPDAEFSFSEAYAPLDFRAARFCELRVWSMFNQVCEGMDAHWDYATGAAPGPRMPLWVKPDRKLSPRDLMTFKMDHLGGTPLDMSQDAGAGPQGLPYRWRPLTWEHEGQTYFNERATATQQTAFSWVAELRGWLPAPIGGILWYGVDDAGLTVHVPFYCGITHVPRSFSEHNGDILTYSESAAFWVFQRVSHTVYLFYDRAIEDLRRKQQELRDRYAAFIPAVDAGALLLHERDPALAARFLTEFTHSTADRLVDEWRELGRFLLVKYLDGNVKKEEDGEFLRNPWGFPEAPLHPGPSDALKRVIIEQTGDRFLHP